MSAENNEESNKRAALAGQWRTPPLPAFASSTASKDLKVPGSSEDYAKALQEAYRRGAEAATLAAQQQGPLPSAVSCPDLTAPDDTTSAADIPILPPPVPNPLSESSSMPPPSNTTNRSISMPDMSTYAAQQEEEKRQKRLARNRASARLRRLRKKNLVRACRENET